MLRISPQLFIIYKVIIMLEFLIGKNDSGVRADRFLLKATSAPSSLIYKTFRKKDVKVNGIRIKEDYILSENETLHIYISDEFLIKKAVKKPSVSVPIVYEDEYIIIFNKPPFLPCQPDKNHKENTLSDFLKSYLYEKGEYLPENENSFSPALCNRLDTNTQGLVIGAKTAASLREMNEHIRLHNVKKYYLCCTEGVPVPEKKTVKAFISKDEKTNKSYISKSGKEILMDYAVISEENGIASVEVLLKTGRSHQIRAYFSSVGCPLSGDKKYGAKKGGGQKLTAYRLVFDFPENTKGVLSYLKGKEFRI